MVTEHWTVISPQLPRHTHTQRHLHEAAAVEEELEDRFPENWTPAFAGAASPDLL